VITAFNVPSGLRDITLTATALLDRWTVTPLPDRWATTSLPDRWTVTPEDE
jgi:hypothetical protein